MRFVCIFITVALLAVTLVVCAWLAAGQASAPQAPARVWGFAPEPKSIKTSPDGVPYALVKIEGRTFVATQGAHGAWTLAGPIDR